MALRHRWGVVITALTFNGPPPPHSPSSAGSDLFPRKRSAPKVFRAAHWHPELIQSDVYLPRMEWIWQSFGGVFVIVHVPVAAVLRCCSPLNRYLSPPE